MYRILGLNGGGIRGYLTLRVLAYLEKVSGCKIADMFDLIVGTSSGALIASMMDLPAEYVANSLRDSYRDRLFKPNWLSFGGLLRTKYNTKSREKLIDNLVGNKTFRKYDFAAVSYDMRSARPVVFNTLEHENNSKYLLTTQYETCDAVKASSAAPMYWDPYELDNMLLVDGALVGNDPTDVAIKLALSKKYTLNDLYIVNITTGNNTRPYNIKSGACPLKWTIPMINMLMSSQANATSMLYTNEGLNYYNLDVELFHGSDDIDDISDDNLFALELDVETLITNNHKAIGQILLDLCGS